MQGTQEKIKNQQRMSCGNCVTVSFNLPLSLLIKSRSTGWELKKILLMLEKPLSSPDQVTQNCLVMTKIANFKIKSILNEEKINQIPTKAFDCVTFIKS